jgi:Holliday junction DNA helicase RuvA
MIAALKGVLEDKTADSLIVEVAGVSFRVCVPAATLGAAGEPGAGIKLHTHLHVREDALTLYGFVTAQERAFFEQLLTVSGVGPRVALSLLSAYSPETLRGAIAAGDLDLLSRVPGIGRKIAGRLVVDLKGKLDVGRLAPSVPIADTELLDGLVRLGYSAMEAQAAVQALPRDRAYTTEERLRLALQFFGGRL